MKMNLLLLITTYCTFSIVFAADSTIKEETTPPPAYGAITPEQLPPLFTTKPVTPSSLSSPASQSTSNNGSPQSETPAKP